MSTAASSMAASVMTEVGRARVMGAISKRRLEMNFMMATGG
jgi:hypothetical protein